MYMGVRMQGGEAARKEPRRPASPHNQEPRGSRRLVGESS